MTTYLSLAEQSLPHLDSPDAGIWLARLEAERDNLRAALGWARDRGAVGQRMPLNLGLRLAAALGPFWFLRLNHHEGRRWLDALLELITGAGSGGVTPRPAGEGEDPRLHTALMWAFLYAGSFAAKEEDMVRAETLFVAGLAAARACGNCRATIMALHGRGVAMLHAGHAERGFTLLQEALRLARQSGNGYAILNVLTELSFLLLVFTRDDDHAIALAEEARALARQVGDARNETYAEYLLGLSALRRDQIPLARRLAREALLSAQQRGATYSVPFGLEALALVAGRAGHGERAARLLGAARVEREREATAFSPAEHAMFDELLAPVRAVMGQDSWAVGYEAGRAVSLESAVAEALGEDE